MCVYKDCLFNYIMQWTPEIEKIFKEQLDELPCKIKKRDRYGHKMEYFCMTHKKELEYVGHDAPPGNVTAPHLFYRCPKSGLKIGVNFPVYMAMDELTSREEFVIDTISGIYDIITLSKIREKIAFRKLKKQFKSNV